MGRLDGKVCLITGAGSGIGQASALLFASEGAQVIVADVDDRGARATVGSIRKAGGRASAEHVDVTVEPETISLAGRVARRLKRIDVLFNNAGISGVGDIVETDPDLERTYGQQIPVVFINGNKTFKYHVDEAELEKRVRRLWKPSTS